MFVSNKTRSLWNPTLSLLRSGTASFEKAPVHWRFTELTIPKIPMAFVECRLTFAGVEAVGLGDSVFFKKAAIKALAEAWERAWMRKLYEGGRVEIKSSNGFAAGRTAQDAVMSARAECAERAIFLSAWEQQRGWQGVSCKGVAANLLLSFLSQRAWKTSFYRIDGGSTGQVVAGLSVHPEFGAVFDTKFAGSVADASCFKGLVRSLLRMAIVQERIGVDKTFTLAESAAPFDHMKFYRDPEHLKAFDFLRGIDATQSLDFDSGEKGRTNCEILCDVSELPAVAYAYNNQWPMLQWGTKAIRGKNNWPHPLA